MMGSVVSTVVGIAYPIWASFKALESSDKEDDYHWLCYWMIYALFNLVESFADVIIGWFPFYNEFKLLLLVLLQLPQLKIPRYIYTEHVRPLLKEKEREIDSFLDNAAANLKKNAVNAVSAGVSKITTRRTEQVINNFAASSEPQAQTAH